MEWQPRRAKLLEIKQPGDLRGAHQLTMRWTVKDVSSDARWDGADCAVELGHWPTWPLLRSDLVRAFLRELAMIVRDSILRRLSRSSDAGIRVSPMTVAWLKQHEREYDKHQADL